MGLMGLARLTMIALTLMALLACGVLVVFLAEIAVGWWQWLTRRKKPEGSQHCRIRYVGKSPPPYYDVDRNDEFEDV